ncbi:MAG: hypothetical protein JNL83_15185, partial [Myxococcales bacterium]|nr:hypothetical protein [Myxococcales bacterium]
MADPLKPFEDYRRVQEEQQRKEDAERRRNWQGRAVPQRIAPLRGVVDAGEIVVGVEETVELGTVNVVDGYAGGGLVTAHVVPASGPRAPGGVLAPGSDGFLVEDAVYGTPIVVSPGTPRPLRVIFRPSLPGMYRSEIVFRVMWQDGKVSEHSVVVRGKARTLDDVPSDARMDHMDPATSARNDPHLKKAPTLDAALSSIEEAADSARDSVDAIADAQKDGVTLAEREALSFVEKPPDPSILAILADVAISMGLAGVAGVLARGAARHLVGLKIKDPAVLKDSKSLLGATDALKEGIKGLSKATVIPTIAKPGKLDPKSPPATVEFSSNSTIDFWAQQRTRIGTLKSAFRSEVSGAEDLARRMGPASGLLFMQAVARSFHEAGNNGEIVLAQALASEVQWISGIAQSTVGATIAHDRVNGDMMTSDLSWLRTHPTFALRDGVVRIAVDADAAGTPAVRYAKLKGISQEIADRIWRTPLLHVPIPVVLEVRDGTKVTRLTRDEAGR